MGKKRIAIVGEEKKEETVNKTKAVEPVVAVVTPAPTPAEEAKPSQTLAKPKKVAKAARKRGKSYRAARQKVDSQKTYPLSEAIQLMKDASISSFAGTAETHIVVVKPPVRKEVSLPHFEAKTRKVEIASDEIIKKLEAGKIDFDILLASPAFMPKLIKYAKLLGPKGLMPNPKNGTITDKPEESVKKFSQPSLLIKTEQNNPLIHTVFGKLSQTNEDLESNLQTIIATIGTKNIKKIVVKPTMGPSVRIGL